MRKTSKRGHHEPLDRSLKQNLVPISKFLSLVLRHKPEVIGLELDAEGWAPVEELLKLAKHAGTEISLDTLLEVIESNDKKRFALSPDQSLIRASQGHSIEVDLGLEPMAPPAKLFHGTVADFVPAIRVQGLLPGQRQFVHLSSDKATARRVGARRGSPVILTIRAARLAASGHELFLSDNGVWLTKAVPPEFIDGASAGRDPAR